MLTVFKITEYALATGLLYSCAETEDSDQPDPLSLISHPSSHTQFYNTEKTKTCKNLMHMMT